MHFSNTPSPSRDEGSLFRDQRVRAMALSLFMAFVMLGGKGAAYFITGSVAILSDALESVIHLLATAFVGYSLWYSMQPADTRHLYGHGKIAYFASGFEGAMILVAAVAIYFTAIRDLIEGPEIRQLNTGMLIIGLLMLVNLALGLFLVFTGKRHNSLVLVANGKHVLTDMWTSLGVLGGLFVVWLTDIVWLDPVVAILVATNIVWTASTLIRQSVAGLMESADPAETAVILRTLEEAREQGVIRQFHQVRHRRVNDQVWVEYHLLFPDRLSITQAHDRSHEVEERVIALFPRDTVYVTAHLEPEAHDASHPEGFSEPDDPLALKDD
jgi:cation diffusion facilitator family transporter